jgi:ribonuclease H / adenosylcobalamin/alpha-ribazole phosphatase
VVTDPEGQILADAAEGIGVATNNVAEYRAALEGLRLARNLGGKEVLLRSDSRLLVEQLSGRFRVKNPTLMRLHGEVRSLLAEFDGVTFEHVPREFNKEADRLANEGVDNWLAGAGKNYRPPVPPATLLD